MSGESAAAVADRERLRIDLDPEIRRAARRVREIGRAVEGTYLTVSTAPALYVMFTVGLGWGLLVAVIVFLIAGAPLYRLRETERTMTDASPEAVREQLLGLDGPLTASWIARADIVRPPSAEEDEDIVAVVEFTTWLVFQREIPVRLSEPREGTIEGVIGNPSTGIQLTASIENEYDSTILEIESRVPRVRLRQIVYYRLIESYARQMLDHYGYRVIESTWSLGLRR